METGTNDIKHEPRRRADDCGHVADDLAESWSSWRWCWSPTSCSGGSRVSSTPRRRDRANVPRRRLDQDSLTAAPQGRHVDGTGTPEVRSLWRTLRNEKQCHEQDAWSNCGIKMIAWPLRLA